ncbi:MAG: hypothetical protein ACI857_000602 [Arenicella sp.]|jgi:hypothetical protein
MTKLKFETENSTHGLTQSRGFAWFTSEGISFEYQVLDTILEVVKSDLKEVFVSFDQVEEIVYEKSWLSGDEVYIKLNSLKNVDDLPFLDETDICLELDKKQRENGKNFVVNAQLELSNFRITQLDKS